MLRQHLGSNRHEVIGMSRDKLLALLVTSHWVRYIRLVLLLVLQLTTS
jgi:hypothetical protein